MEMQFSGISESYDVRRGKQKDKNGHLRKGCDEFLLTHCINLLLDVLLRVLVHYCRKKLFEF